MPACSKAVTSLCRGTFNVALLKHRSPIGHCRGKMEEVLAARVPGSTGQGQQDVPGLRDRLEAGDKTS